MFDATGGEPPSEGAAAGVREQIPDVDLAGSSAAEKIVWEPNGAWAERDWSNVPVIPRSDEPPADWQPETTWLDELEDVTQGPMSWFDHLEPSGRLMSELENLPPESVETDADAVEMVAHWARLEAHCAMQKRRSAAALAQRTVMAEGLTRLDGLGVRTHQPNIAGDELSLRLGIGRRAAQTLVRSGRAFDAAAIPTGDALAAGEIDAGKADLIVAGIEDLEPDAALAVQDRVLERARHIPTGRLRRELAAARAAVDTEHFEERCTYAAAARRVDEPRILPDGMASLYAVMPAVETVQLYRAIDAAARSAKAAGDTRTLDQLRADALALMGAAAVQTGWLGACPRPHLDDLDALDMPADSSHTASTTQQAAPEQSDDDAGSAGGGRAHPPTLSASSSADSSHPPDMPPEHPPRPARASSPGEEPSRPSMSGAGGADAAPVGSVPQVRRGRPEVEPDCSMRVGVIGGRSAHIRVVVPLTSLMGGSGGPGHDRAGADDPAILEGYGPIPASVARALAAGGPWARMVTDPVDRTVLEISRDRYEPPAAMAELVRAREPECVHPACSASSDRCDLHHRLPWPVGPTSVANLDPGCRRDHLLVTHGGWCYTIDDRGRRTWTTPTGLRYVEERDGAVTLRKPGRLPLPSSVDDDTPPPF